MTDQKESSALINLKELMQLEEERVETEQAEIQAREEAAKQAKIEAERKAREDEEARVRAAEEARLSEERKKREEEEARLREREEHKIRVQMEEEARQRADEQQRLMAHETKLKEIESKRRKGLHPAVLFGIVVILLGAGAGVYYGVIVPKQEEAERRAEIARIEAERRAQELADFREEMQQLQEQLSAAQAGSMEAEDLRRQMAQLQESMMATRRAPRRPRSMASMTSSMMSALDSSMGSDPLEGL